MISRLRLVASALLLSALAPSVVACGSGASQSPQLANTALAGAATYNYEIPLGTGAKVDKGESVTVLPESLRVHVGESIRIVNDDTRGHLAGPFFVGAGQTLTQRFTRVGRIAGACSVHVSGTFVLEVDP